MDLECMLLANGSYLDRDEGLPRVYKRFAYEDKADCHVTAHEEGPTFTKFVFEDCKRVPWFAFSSKKALVSLCRIFT